MTGNRSGHLLRPDIGFLELFASANTKANTCAYLSGLTIIIPRLKRVINPYKLALLLTASGQGISCRIHSDLFKTLYTEVYIYEADGCL